MNKNIKNILVIAMTISFLGACSPTVQVQAPDKPIEINLNIKIEQEIRVKVDKELDNLFENSDLFGTTE